MQTLNEDLKSGQFRRAYLLFGEEAFLKKSYKNVKIFFIILFFNILSVKFYLKISYFVIFIKKY